MSCTWEAGVGELPPLEIGMKVWAVLVTDYECGTSESLWSTEEKAQERANYIRPILQARWKGYGVEIKEIEVDIPGNAEKW